MEYGSETRQKSRLLTEEILKTRPKTLVGSEMIFEIATSLQDVLDNTWIDPSEIVPLDEERANKEKAAQVRAHEDDTLRRQRELRLQQEEEQLLQELVKQRISSSAQHLSQLPGSPGGSATDGSIPIGIVKFERPSRTIRTPSGKLVAIDMVHQKVRYREGPLCEVLTVQPFSHLEGYESDRGAPFLVLKEFYATSSSNDEPSMKRAVQNLESKLEYHMNLSPHQSITQPLNFHIHRSVDEESVARGWNVSILMELAERQSLQEILDVVDKLDVKLVRAWSIQLIEGLRHYHRHGSAHADIHLGNVLLQRDREAERGDNKITVAMLSDGGYGRDLHIFKKGSGPKYFPDSWTAPEMLNASASAEAIPATDIWDLGRCFLQMAFGVGILSEHSSGPMSLVEELRPTPSLRALLSQIFSSNPKKRPSAWDLLHFEFFRNNDALLKADPPERSQILETSMHTQPDNRMRRESGHTSVSLSRYAKDFAEDGRLGRGGFGEVFRARNKVDGQPYAIKKVKARSKAALDPVLSEVTVLSRLNHPNVVRFFTSWIEDAVSMENPDLSGSSEDEYTSSLTNAAHRPILPASSRGLDFISSTDAPVIFATDDDEEKSGSEDEDSSENQSEEESEANGAMVNVAFDTEESSPSTEQGSRRVQTPSTWTVLYIQMEYCKQEVSLFWFLCPPAAGLYLHGIV